jgi:hypothetical protein
MVLSRELARVSTRFGRVSGGFARLSRKYTRERSR